MIGAHILAKARLLDKGIPRPYALIALYRSRSAEREARIALTRAAHSQHAKGMLRMNDKGRPMIDVKTADKELQTYIRPQTFPVAIRMLKPGEPIPERARRPARDFKKLSMSCQVIDMARRYGWMLARHRRPRVRASDAPAQLGHAVRGDVHGDQDGRAALGSRGGPLRARRVQ